ncbi:putative cytochrome oxidase biogenesis protein 1-1 (OXA1) [Babesia bovis T2Bo]|uniref:Cytochrome oxidase biogenesis protein 1-1 (OXA1), putative n=1 Tax=Babesia bovis TaxID=5865 RepID=A7AVL5_BABBO|nr:putative cytochrome oxidase biogenesis protein 1-1 (OXA1) [Babesia bovis T2Bo]EDO05841.1 putative cytochrome oxidase biogenesis protein 1-1 (OXA1) [Babesia bovis T2Bo]|eukprot:XP_001609409.1 cytochrome oxidase biogenesis protein 1-1 (OXA1) [Babesia bovis T2Bo]
MYITELQRTLGHFTVKSHSAVLLSACNLTRHCGILDGFGLLHGRHRYISSGSSTLNPGSFWTSNRSKQSSLDAQSSTTVDTSQRNGASSDNESAPLPCSTASTVELTPLGESDGHISDPVQEALFELVESHNGNRKGIIQRMLPVEFMRDVLTNIHESTGLSWATTITLLTLTMKVAFIPLWAMGERARRNNAHLVPIATELQERLAEARKEGNVKKSMEIQRIMYKQMLRKSFLKSAGLQILAAGTQGLTFAWVYGGLKMFAIEPRICPDFVMESPLWLKSLALPDPYYIFPATLYALMMSIYEMNRVTAERMRKSSGKESNAMREQEERQVKMKYFTRAALGMFALFSCSMTSSTFFYLIPSFMFQTILRYLTQGGPAAKALRLPIPVIPPSTKSDTKRMQKVKGF